MFLPCRPCCTPSICGVSGCSVPDELTLEVLLGSIVFNDNNNVSAGEITEIRSLLDGAFVLPFKEYIQAPFRGSRAVYELLFEEPTSWQVADAKFAVQVNWYCENTSSSLYGSTVDFFFGTTAANNFFLRLGHYTGTTLADFAFFSPTSSAEPSSVSGYCGSPADISVTDFYTLSGSLVDVGAYFQGPSGSQKYAAFEATAEITIMA